MDTRLKNVKDSLGFRALCIVLSLVMMASAAVLAGDVLRAAGIYRSPAVFYDSDYLADKDMADTYNFSVAFSKTILSVNLLAAKDENARLMKELEAQREAQVDQLTEKYNKEKAVEIQNCLIYYAEMDYTDTADVIQYGCLPDYTVPDKTLKTIVPYDKDAPALIRDLQQIVNGTKQGTDYLRYQSLAESLPEALNDYDDAHCLSNSGMDLTFSFSLNGVSYSADTEYYDFSLSEDVLRESLNADYSDLINHYRITDSMLEEAQAVLDANSSVHYYAKNSLTGTVVSNLGKTEKISDLAEDAVAVYTQKNMDCVLQDHEDFYWSFDYGQDESLFDQREAMGCHVEISACVLPVQSSDDGDIYYEIEQMDAAMHGKNTVGETVVAAVLALLSIAFLILGLVFCGHRSGYDGIKLAWVDKIPTDLHAALSAGCVTILMMLLALLIDEASTNVALLYTYYPWALAAGAAVVTAIWAIYTELTYSFVRVCKSEKRLYKNCLIWMLLVLLFKMLRWIFRRMRRLNRRIIRALQYTPKHFRRNMFWTLFLYTLINIIFVFLFVIWLDSPLLCVPVALAFAVFNGWCLWYALHFLYQLDEVIDAASERRAPRLNTEKLHPALLALTNSLKYTNDELKAAVAKAVRDERLKTELITNVSHDLKTPLTSIISYVDLLTRCEIEDAKAREYIAVLNDKSGKLKRLIEDLIEASKVSTGNIALHPMPLNLSELAAQAVGESQKEFEKNRLQVVLADSDADVTVFADGSKTFRILENLLSNAKKYSASGSRVYVSVYEQGDTGVFEIKNISAQPLNISPDELTERFVRGDESRSREGNGLGLSIAKELCTAQKGKLELVIDGDLFKARVYLPKADA